MRADHAERRPGDRGGAPHVQRRGVRARVRRVGAGAGRRRTSSCIVCDDRSRDATWSMLQAYAATRGVGCCETRRTGGCSRRSTASCGRRAASGFISGRRTTACCRAVSAHMRIRRRAPRGRHDHTAAGTTSTRRAAAGPTSVPDLDARIVTAAARGADHVLLREHRGQHRERHRAQGRLRRARRIPRGPGGVGRLRVLDARERALADRLSARAAVELRDHPGPAQPSARIRPAVHPARTGRSTTDCSCACPSAERRARAALPAMGPRRCSSFHHAVRCALGGDAADRPSTSWRSCARRRRCCRWPRAGCCRRTDASRCDRR